MEFTYKPKMAIIILLLWFGNACAQNLVAKYESTNIFSRFIKPISIGIFNFDNEVNTENKILEGIGKVANARESFIFYPSQTLESLKEDLNIESLNIFNLNILNKLKENLDIQLILAGKKVANNDLQIDLINTENGNSFFTNIYKTSKNSTPIQDIIKLFTEQQTTIYKREIRNLPEMVLIEKGEIEVGVGLKKHIIKVENDFYISKYECTTKQFAEFIVDSGYITDAERNHSNRIWNDEKMTNENGNSADSLIINSNEFKDEIVTNVSWNDAIAFCDWLSKKTGEKFRLAYENEWKFAASLFDYRDYTKYLKGNNSSQVSVPDEFRFIRKNISDWVCSENNVAQSIKKYSLKQTLGVKNISDFESFLESKLENKKPNYYNTNIAFRVVKEIQ